MHHSAWHYHMLGKAGNAQQNKYPKEKKKKTTSINGKITANLQAVTLLENAASEVTRAHFILH